MHCVFGNEQDVGLSDANPILPTAAGVAVWIKFLRSRILKSRER
ncbi:hypothetical protein LV84_01411 [Algoriphagus ratkowskyi]|uniref:Uncharacterized protein n=1 Tax=Algoriphagus ratkowskyi TaxID=57028 RepID=A0A2W7RLK8_9BACT|nr:hypothetical protein LV84_01411 [Algoriphagus ratkowskyi]